MSKVVHKIEAKVNNTIEGNTPERKRVAAYIRVSSDHEEQESSYESQGAHFKELIEKHPEWDMVRVFGDEGVSGLSTTRRTGFNSMMRAAKRGEIDMILVKSISRFARNTVTTLSSLRELAEYGTVVYFEKENMMSDDPSCQLLLSIMASMAEAESISISQNTQAGIRYKFERGEWSVGYSTFLGYDKVGDEVVINEEQARTVKRIFELFLSGMCLHDVATTLEAEGHLTGVGNAHWDKNSVSRALSNIKYSGDILLQKTYTADVLAKKRVPNKGERPQYYVENGIPAIVTKQESLLAIGELKRRERAYKGEVMPGPRIRADRNDFTGIITCRECGDHLNRFSARGVFYWKCYWRANGDCKGEILKEAEIQEAVLNAAKTLWDKQPKVKMKRVPWLTKDTPEDVLVDAAAKYMHNAMAKRIEDFLAGERPTEYTSYMGKNLIERIEFSATEFTFYFYGELIIKIPRTDSKIYKRRLTRISETQEEHDE